MTYQQIYQQNPGMSANGGRTSANATAARYPRKIGSFVGFGERWRMSTNAGGSSMWWARQDSNLQPDRYERPALTIELQAPPRPARNIAGQRCRHRLQGGPPRRNAARAAWRRLQLSPPTHRQTPPPCAIFRSHRQTGGRIRPASSASGCRQARRTAPPASGPSSPR